MTQKNLSTTQNTTQNSNLVLSNARTSLRITNNLLATQDLTEADWSWWFSLDDNWKITLLNALHIHQEKHQFYVNNWCDKNAMVHTLKHLIKLKRLHIQDSNLTNLIPLGYLVNLTGLSLQKNSIADVSPLVRLRNLSDLNLENNQIYDITPLSQLQNLIALNLKYNHFVVSDIDWLQCQLPHCIINHNAIIDMHQSTHWNTQASSIFQEGISSFM